MAAPHAEAVQKFYTAHFNPYLNYHRPCGFATTSFNARGKRTRRYKAAVYQTPYEKLKSLPEACLLDADAFEFWNEALNAWTTCRGTYRVMLCLSPIDIVFT